MEGNFTVTIRRLVKTVIYIQYGLVNLIYEIIKRLANHQTTLLKRKTRKWEKVMRENMAGVFLGSYLPGLNKLKPLQLAWHPGTPGTPGGPKE
jgi:hypothetical protein